MKDLWYRYSTLLLKKNVVFRAGWDCQGLPVELQAEKELGLSGNKWEDLKQIGEEKLVEACKRLLGKYLQPGRRPTTSWASSSTTRKAYMTYKDSLHREGVEVPRAGLGETGSSERGSRSSPTAPAA